MDQFEQNQEREIDLAELFGALRPYILHVVLVALICGMLSFLYTKLLVKPVYESSASIVVNNRRNDEGFVTTDELNSARNLANLYAIVIKSDSVMTPVLDTVNVDLTSQQLADKVSVSSVNNTSVIRIAVTDTDPNMALKYVEEIVDVAPEVIVDKVEAGSVSVISEASLPADPISPNTMMNVLIATVLGAMAIIGFVLLRYFLDRSVKSEEELERILGLPVISVIPSLESLRGKGK